MCRSFKYMRRRRLRSWLYTLIEKEEKKNNNDVIYIFEAKTTSRRKWWQLSNNILYTYIYWVNFNWKSSFWYRLLVLVLYLVIAAFSLHSFSFIYIHRKFVCRQLLIEFKLVHTSQTFICRVVLISAHTQTSSTDDKWLLQYFIFSYVEPTFIVVKVRTHKSCWHKE